MALRAYLPGRIAVKEKMPLELVYAVAITVMSGRSSSTTAPIWGMPAESLTSPVTVA